MKHDFAEFLDLKLVTKKFLIRHTLSLSFSETQCCTKKIVQ